MSIKKNILYSIFILALIICGCGKKAKIVGEIFDGFGVPLKNAIVSIKGTTFKATTDAEGKYSIGYVPGKIRIDISKDGYTSESLDFDIAVESKFPAQRVILYKLPTGNGIWLLGKSDYISINKGKISSRQKDLDFRGYDKPAYENIYTAIGEFTSINNGDKTLFLDNQSGKMIIIKLKNNNVILTETLNFTGMLMGGPYAISIEDKQSTVGEGLLLREVILEKGKYAFVTLGTDLATGLGLGDPIAEPIYLFEVRDLGEKGEIIDSHKEYRDNDSAKDTGTEGTSNKKKSNIKFVSATPCKSLTSRQTPKDKTHTFSTHDMFNCSVEISDPSINDTVAAKWYKGDELIKEYIFNIDNKVIDHIGFSLSLDKPWPPGEDYSIEIFINDSYVGSVYFSVE